VDHDFHLKQKVPHQALAEQYDRNILGSKPIIHKLKVKRDPDGGNTKKVLYEVGKAPLFGHPDPLTYMVKPYHERVIRRVKGWMRYPIQGWSEMTNQALYHAAGIGHLHQKVHTADHNIGNGVQPHLVIAMDRGFRTPHQERPSKRLFQANPDLELSVKQTTLMDFLTNNVDRHAGNILYNPSNGKLLNVDHSRSFQYKTTLPRVPGENSDKIANYTRGGLNYFEDAWEDANPDKEWNDSELWKSAFDWIGDAQPALEKTLQKHLKAIKDPKIRAHIWRNFKTRLDLLKEMADFDCGNYGHYNWSDTEIPIYQPNELTDQEQREARWKAGGT
jgi:hypothetical protein